MNKQVVLCLDSESLLHPEIIGLPDENLEAQSWLTIYSDATKARNALAQDKSKSLVWVISSDSLDGINLAAALKADDAVREVYFITFEQSGSVVGRCEAAGVEVLRGKHEFVKEYTKIKQSFRGLEKPKMEDAVSEEAQNGRKEAKCFEENSRSDTVCKSESHVKERSQAKAIDVGKSKSISSLVIDEPLLNLSRAIRPSSGKADTLTIAVVSGSGGSGKSTIALCSALVYQEFGYKTLLLDADLQFGDMAYLLGRDSALSIVDLIEEPGRISQVTSEDGLPALIASPEFVEQSELVMNHMAEIIEFVKDFFDVVVINTGSFWTEQHAQIIESVDKTLFVLDQRPSSVRSCSRALTLCSRCGIAIQSFAYALNFCTRHALLTPLDISCAMQGVSVQEIKDGGKEVSELLGASLPKELLSTKNVFIQSVRDLCVSFLPEGERERFQEELDSERAQRKGNPFSSLRRRRVACL